MSRAAWPIPGIPDEAFLREEGVPMTKFDIRVLSLVRLRLFPRAVVYDVGAGSGSVAVEIQRMIPEGTVYAVEKNPRALPLLEANCRRFSTPLRIIQGTAPEALTPLPPADRIFIGGSGGQLNAILDTCHTKLAPGGIMVINSVTLHTASDAVRWLKKQDYEIQISQVQIAVCTTKGNTELWQARNPVTILAAQKKEETSCQ